MKKAIIICFSLLSLFGGMSLVKADTLYRTSAVSGSVDVTLSTTEGYIGAADITLSLTGKVVPEQVIFDASLSGYTKKYTYDQKNQTMRIIIATGSKTKNLVDRNGMIKIGTIAVKSTTGSDEVFNIIVGKVTVANVNYSASRRDHVANDSEETFTYTVKPKGNTVEENGSGAKQPGNSDTTTNKTVDKQDGKKATDETTLTTEKDTDKKDIAKEDKKKTNKEIKKEKEQKKNNILYVVTIGVFAILIITCAVYVRKNNK